MIAFIPSAVRRIELGDHACFRTIGPWRTVEDLELATLGWVHWHNNQGLHGYIGGPARRVRADHDQMVGIK